MAVQQYPAGAAGGTSNLTQAEVAATTPSYTLRHTITSSTNNFATNAGQVFVYAVVMGGGGGSGNFQGYGGTSGLVQFGMTPVRAVVQIGGSATNSVFGNIQSGGGVFGQGNSVTTTSGNFYQPTAGNFSKPSDGNIAAQSGIAAGGGQGTGNQNGGNSVYGFNGGSKGNNAPGANGGMGGGAGMLGNGGNGGPGNQNNGNTSVGGTGGAGGGGGGAGGSNNNFCGTSYAAAGAGGAGCVLVYY